MLANFKEAVRFLETFIPPLEKRHPGKLGLERMEYLCSLLGNPQLQYPTIHVGGTSGKGSTATIIASILATKYKVGLCTSPHLETICERIKIINKWKMENGKWKMLQKNQRVNYESENITEKEFTELVNYLLPYIYKVEGSEYGRPTYFEIITVMAFLYFKKKKVDIAVVEVGMGGRYDATNVIRPLVVALTNVGLDHTEILGETVEEIAEDKAGIIKKGIQVVSGIKQPSVVRIIEGERGKGKGEISLLDRDFSYRIKKVDIYGSSFDYYGRSTFRNLKVTMLGAHQVENAALAIRVVELLNNPIESKFSIFNFQFSINEIRKGLDNVYIPGRLEIISRKPLIILDGAHNPDKVKALARAMKQIFPKKKVIAIVAIKSDKDAGAILKSLLPICRQVIFTEFQLTGDIGAINSYRAEELLRIAGNLNLQLKSCYRQGELVRNKMLAVHDVHKALEHAKKEAGRDDLILVTGSLYLVGEMKNNLQFEIFNEFSLL